VVCTNLNLNETRKDNLRKPRIQFGNTNIWYVSIWKNQENIQEIFGQP
jgi:hypothetical protein